jgi:Tfp pilus assembly protein PilF
MILIFAALLVLFSGNVHAADVTQKTAGWCSPAVADVKGNVQIICNGVDPRAMQRLNELLDIKDKELKSKERTIQDKIQEAEEWARKYRELEERLSNEGEDSTLARQAKELLQEGKLDEAGALLDKLLDSGEKKVEQIASYHFSRAEMFSLQFKPLEALPHYEKAYQYRPENYKYAFGYSSLLQNQNNFSEAEPVLLTAMQQVRKLARANPTVFKPNLVNILNNMILFYRETERLADSANLTHELEVLRTQSANQQL